MPDTNVAPEQTAKPTRTVHGLHLVSAMDQELGCYNNFISIMLSDVTPENTVKQAQQFNMQFQPYMDATTFVQALREFADALEAYHRENPIEVG